MQMLEMINQLEYIGSEQKTHQRFISRPFMGNCGNVTNMVSTRLANYRAQIYHKTRLPGLASDEGPILLE